MKKVFTDNLPKKLNRNKICIDWQNSVGLDVKFICEDIEGTVKIISYNKKTYRLNVKYKEIEFNIDAYHFLEGKLSNILGIKTTRYKYNIGEIINGLEILEHIRYGNGKYKQKGYKYKCIKDEYIGEITENSIINGRGCPVCSNNLVVKGINDIATTHPNLLLSIVNINDAYSHSIGTKTKIQTQCIFCGYQKMLQPILLKNYLFKCPRCGDGVSYPEKFMFCFLEQLDINFITQKMFKWSKRRVYDFYLPDYNMIIETHGLQHYKFTGGNWDLPKIEKENDRIKMEYALNNGINNYIIIDCRESEMEWIKDNIIKSNLSRVFNINNIDWIKCHEYGCSSRVKEVCDLWNSGIHSSLKISKILKMARITVMMYIEKGLILKWFK